MSRQYERPQAQDGGAPAAPQREHRRLFAARCSAVLSDLTREHAAFYPDYDAAIDASRRALRRLSRDHVVLTNGLDDGIMLASLVALRGATAADPLRGDRRAAGVRHVRGLRRRHGRADRRRAAAGRTSSSRWQRVVDAITPRTRIIFLTSPNNPTGLSIPKDSVAAVARAAPAAMVFLDEAYADFAGQSMIDDAASGAIPNLVVGRTFAKAFGLAGTARRRAGRHGRDAGADPPRDPALHAQRLRGGRAAGRARRSPVLRLVPRGGARVEDAALRACSRALGVRFWPSDGNFVLACFGDDLARVIAGLASRGINIRDRSGDPGCAGCARITAGVVDHTRQLVAALEEVLCAAR